MTPTQSTERQQEALALQRQLEESESQVSTSASLAPFGEELGEFHFPCTACKVDFAPGKQAQSSEAPFLA